MHKKILLGILAFTVMLSSAGCMSQSKTDDQKQNGNTTVAESEIYLDYSDGIEAGVYQWILSEDKKYYVLVSVDEDGKPIEAKEKEINVGANNKERMDKKDFSGAPKEKGDRKEGRPEGAPDEKHEKEGFPGNSQAGTVYQGTYTSSNITNPEYQTMLVYVPAEYFNTDSNGMVTGINETAKIGDYTAKTAPVVYLNECGGWKSSQPKSCDTTFIDQGMIYVTAGARSRDAMDANGNITGKSPTQVVDLKAGIIELRANTDIIPGDMDKIISDGTKLTLTGLREGSYYDAILDNISDALNASVAAGEIDVEKEYSNYENWMKKNEDGSYQITSLPGFMVATGLVNQRNKAIPGFDAMDKSAENDAFGSSDQSAVHYSSSVAKILKENYEELSTLEGFSKEDVDSYIEEALEGDTAELVEKQTNLMNGTEILLGTGPYKSVDSAKYWRVRSGTADQHTSFTIGYNICLSAEMLSLDTDYHLVWNMGHGSNEGTSTGSFLEWIKSIA